jgi:hypothetical protein
MLRRIEACLGDPWPLYILFDIAHSRVRFRADKLSRPSI